MGRAQSGPGSVDEVDFNFGENAEQEAGLQSDFALFHLSNPEVYETLVDLARKAKKQGKAHCGIGMLWEVARWEFWLHTDNGSGWKLNNSFRSRYARLIMRQEEDLAGYFTIRELRS